MASPNLTATYDFKIRHLERIFIAMQHELHALIRNNNDDNTSPCYLVSLKKLANMCRILFMTKGNVDRALEVCKNRLERVQNKIDRFKPRKRKPLFRPIDPRFSFYFRSEELCCKENTDYRNIVESGHQFVSCLPKSNVWRISDGQKLHRCIRHYIIKQQSDPIMEQLRNVYYTVKSTSVEGYSIDLEQRVEELRKKTDQLKNTKMTKLLENHPNDINWQWISEHFPGRRFTAFECETMWNLVAHPNINNRPWSNEEDLLLNSLVNMYRFQNWEAISDEMGTNRTAFLCFARYQQFRQPRRNAPKRYTQFENKLVDEFIDKKDRCFTKLAKQFAVTRQQAKVHVKYIQNIRNKIKGKFCADEKFRIDYFLKKGFSCRQISQKTRRSTKQIYDYKLRTKRRLVPGKWNRQETKQLLEALKYFGIGNWTKISCCIPNRSPTCCKTKYRHLLLHHPDVLANYVKKKPTLGHVKQLLNDRRNTLSSRKSSSIDSKIENYFVKYFQQRNSLDADPAFVAESVTNIMKYLNLNVKITKNRNIGEWLLNYCKDAEVQKPNTTIFNKLTVSKENLVYDKKSKFSSLVPRSGSVLPPNKCSIYGWNNFRRNFESYTVSKNINMEKLWNDIDAEYSRNKEFTQAKLMWYKVLKGLFYWPIKLNSTPLDNFL